MKNPRIFYGYWIIAACFICSAICSGSTIFSFTFFVTPLQADLGWRRTEIMAAFTILSLSAAVASPYIGRLTERLGARRIFPLGALVICLGFVLLSQMHSLWQYYVGYAFVGIGFITMGPIPSTYVISQWFSRRRGTALGIMSMGMGLSGIVIAPFVAVYLIPNFGWSGAYLALGMIAVGIVIPLSLLVIRTRPAEMGLLPDGAESPDITDISDAKVSPSGGLSLKAALATPSFWLMAISLAMLHTQMGVSQNLAPHLTDMGFPVSVTSLTVGIQSVICALSMPFFGWICDKIPAKFASSIGLSAIALGILILINIKPGTPVVFIWLFAVIFGFGTGHSMPTVSMLTITTFGLSSYGAIFGMLSFFQFFGGASGPLLAGYLYDSTNTYQRAFVIILAMIVLAIPLILAVRRPPSHPAKRD